MIIHHNLNNVGAIGSYSQAVEITNPSSVIYVTGQVAIDENATAVYPDDIEKQTHLIFENINRILEKAGSSLEKVVKATIYLTDMNDFTKVSPIRNIYFKDSKPASTLVEIKATAIKGCDIEIEVIAVK